MVQTLEDWVNSDVRLYEKAPLPWLSQYHFFRDPTRPGYTDPGYFFSPADGVVLYQKTVKPDDEFIDIKGAGYALRDALRDPYYDKPSLVIGIFMTFFDVHVNRIPFSGTLSYRLAEPIDTFNHPMLDVEKDLCEALRIDLNKATYLHSNQRMINRVDAPTLGQEYYILQIADYDVDCITPFDVRQNQPQQQGSRFSQIRYGSQVELIIPLSERHDFVPMQPTSCHVQAGIDPLVRIQ